MSWIVQTADERANISSFSSKLGLLAHLSRFLGRGPLSGPGREEPRPGFEHTLPSDRHRWAHRAPAAAVAIAFFFTPIACALAAGTPAGTLITNTAMLSCSYGGVPKTPITSAPATIRVHEIINVTLVWQDNAPVSVSTPDTSDALTVLLTNTGNGSESFALSRNNTLGGDNYDPANGSTGEILLENGLPAGFQASGPNADTLYISGT